MLLILRDTVPAKQLLTQRRIMHMPVVARGEMNGPSPNGQPHGPTVPPSESEQEQQMVSHALQELSDADNQRRIGLGPARQCLLEVGLDIDDCGFIIDGETGEYATPHAFDPDTFFESDAPADDPFDAYYQPEEEITLLILQNDRLHLSDLHTITYVDGEPRPVRDNKIALRRMHSAVGLAFTNVMQWSDAADLAVDDDSGPKIVINKWPGDADEEPATLSCLNCDFEGHPDDWNGDTQSEPECPDCGGLWNTRGLEICTACQTTHWWEAMEHGGDMYSEPKCPNCEAGVKFHESQTYYDYPNPGFENIEDDTVPPQSQ